MFKSAAYASCLIVALTVLARAAEPSPSEKMAKTNAAFDVCIAKAKQAKFADLTGKVPTLQENGGPVKRMLSLTHVATPRERKLLVAYDREVYECVAQATDSRSDYHGAKNELLLRWLETGKITFAQYDLFKLSEQEEANSIEASTEGIDEANAKIKTAIAERKAAANAAQVKYLVCHNFSPAGRWVDDLNFEIDPKAQRVNGAKADFTPSEILYAISASQLADINRLSSTFSLVGMVADVDRGQVLGSGPCEIATSQKF